MSNNSPSRKIDPSIIAALIGVCGTIMVTLITLFASRLQVAATPTSPAYARCSSNSMVIRAG